jgi:BirA family transcriptional regulator, biotin operon repressor / biotin---[acetyl-CoA-carboxylase] ligase
MNEARSLASRGFPTGTVVVADRQTSGRGRFRDRAWTSVPGKDLTFTILLDGHAGSLAGFPLRAGLALHRAITNYAQKNGGCSTDFRIKWPNDLLVNGRKISGILCENAGARAYLGIGVNCGVKPAAGDGFRTAPGGLAKEFGMEIDRFLLLELFLEELVSVLNERGWAREVTQRLWLRDQRVQFRTGLADTGAPGARTVEGILRAVDESGALVLETEAGCLPFVSGELVAPPAGGASGLVAG